MAKGVKGSTPTDDTKKERTSFNISGVNSKKLKVIAAIQAKDMSSIVDGLIADMVKAYEKENGSISLK